MICELRLVSYVEYKLTSLTTRVNTIMTTQLYFTNEQIKEKDVPHYELWTEECEKIRKALGR